MNRRQYLSSLLLTVPLSGCTLISRTNNQSQTSDPGPSEDIFIFITNERAEQITVSLTVMNNDRSVIGEESTTLSSKETIKVYTGITETGDYPYVFSLNGQQQFEYTYNVDDFRLQNGLDIDISVEESDIQVSAED